MSFILDALKKSENERQRQLGPSLADIPTRRAHEERPWWAVAVAALLVVNLGVLIAVLTRDRTPTSDAAPHAPASQQPVAAPAAPAAQPQAMTAAPPQPVTEAPRNASPAVRSLAEEAGVDEGALPLDSELEDVDPALAGAASVPEGPPVVRSVTPPTVAPLSGEPTFAARNRSDVGAEPMLPTHGTLVAGGTNLPDMRLDIHVYSPKPAERFVFINMRKYTEGQTTAEGASVERITTDGAILNQNGTRFLLPRQ